MPPLLEALSELLELDEEATAAEVTAGAEEAAERLPWKPVTFAPLLSYDETELAEASETEDNPYLSHGRPKGGVCLAPSSRIYHRVRRELDQRDYTRSREQLRHRQQRIAHSDLILNLIMTGIYDGLGLSRVLYAAVGPDGETLKTRYVRGAAGDPVFHRFRVDLSRPSLVQEIMARPAAVKITPAKLERLEHRTPRALHLLAEQRSCAIASLFANGEPHGLIYADRHRIDNAIDDTTFRGFRRICALGASRLTDSSPP